MLITSVNNSRIKELVRLKDKKYRDQNNLFFVEGIDAVSEAYKAGVIRELYVLDGYDNLFDIPCIYISIDVMKKISDMDSVSEYYCVCNKMEEKEIGDKLLILDNIQDPGNLGTIIRSSVAFDIDTIVISKGSVDLYNPKVIRSTKGMIFNKNIIVREIDKFILSLDGYTIYGTDVSFGTDIKKIDIPRKMGIVIGNEGTGISETVRKLCNDFLYINMNDKCESLNASVAASILMYEVYNK